ncbi:MAG TPA: lipid-A-disaccharide synthase [Luteitalea sp.]|nr:lipid-A-disaccharide synthase [Luteitalea sp.]
MAGVMISCGEPSGDLYAGALATALRRRAPGLDIYGFGGSRLSAAGGELIGSYEGHSVTGLAEVVRTLPRTWRMYRQLVAEAERRRPDVFVAIDFADFNFRLGQALHRRGIPVVYYIGPQLWAWRPGRMQVIKRFADKVLVIFPFEQALYEKAGVPVSFVGHPLIDLIGRSSERTALLIQHGLSTAARTIAVLPGSRRNEVAGTLPTLLEACTRLREAEPDLQFLIARAPGLDDEQFAAVRQSGLPIGLHDGDTDAVLAASDLVLTASGTATVQTALHGKPMVIVYRLSPLTYRLGRRFVKLDTFGMVNLIAGRRIVPELIQDDFTVARVVDEALRFLRDEAYTARVRADLAAVVTALGGPGASERAATEVLAVATRRA